MSVKIIDTGYRPRRPQAQVHASRARFKVVIGHRRIGKTHLGLNELTHKSLLNMKKNPQYAYIAPTYGQAKRIAWDLLKDYTKNIPGVEVNESELRVDIPRPHLQDRIRIMLLGAENPASILGMYLDGVVFDEYGDMNPIVWTQVVRPLLSDRLGWAIFIGTPKGQNHFHALYTYGKTADDWETFLFKASETGIIPKSELDENRAIMSESEYMQEFECFVPGTLVATSKGSVKIEDLRVGDVALTHRNRFHIITRTMSKDYNGKLLKINHYGTSEPLLVTKEHPFLVYTRKGQKREWVKAEDLNNTMYLVTPKLSKKMPIVNENFLKLVAWYLSEGSVNGNSVTFALNQNNIEEQNEVTEILKSLGYKYKFYAGTCLALVVCSTGLADTLVSLCGSLAENKRIPFDIIAGHEKIFFDTMIKGDGHIVRGKDKIKWYLYTTISKGLAYDMQILAATLGRRSRVQVRPPYQGNILGREVNCAESYVTRISYKFKVNHSSLKQVFPTKFGIANRIISIKEQEYCGKVHNISVKQDESYVAGGVAVHNCSFAAALVGAYYGKEMEWLEQNNKITAVPHDTALLTWTGWDLGIDDTTVIWFIQQYGREIRVIDYMESSGAGLDTYVKAIMDKPYTYAGHILPHDVKVRELSDGKSRLDKLKALGLKNIIVAPKLPVADGIEATRSFLKKCVFDRIACANGISALQNYERKYDVKNKVFQMAPYHNWASHGADGMRTLVLGLRDDSSDTRLSTKNLPRYTTRDYSVV